ncbi:MAG TPA: hypothetical protein VG013_21635 [Gemmataceae bacterium]|nr:hypothetical protein [Gemmataceae bacterium]
MTRTCWLTATAAALLLALNAGPARCQECPAAPESKWCSDKAVRPCTGTETDAHCCTKGSSEHSVKEKVAELLDQFQDLYKEGKYAEAETCAKAALEIAPDNPVIGAAIKMAHVQKRQAEHQHTYADFEARRAQREAFADQLWARFQECVAGRGTPDILLEAQRFWEAALASENEAIVDYAQECKGPCSGVKCAGTTACCPKCAGTAISCPKCDAAPCYQTTGQAASCCEECAGGCKCCSKCKATAASCAKDAAGTCRPNCTGAASKCPKCDDAPCCQGTARAAACCDECANGCKCCPKCREAAACSAKGAAGTCCVQPAGCGACAGTGAATGCCTKPCRGKKPGTVIFLPLPPLPGSPIPVPPILPVGFAEPAPPMPPAYSCPPPVLTWQPARTENVYVAEPPCPPCYAHPVPMMPPPAVACSVAQPCRHASCACCMKLSAEDGKAHLEVAGCGETAMTCESLVLKVSGSSPLKVAVADKQVQISNSYLKATADSVARMSGDDCLVLEGNVHLDYHKDDKHTEAAADRVVIGLADGSFKIEPVATPDAKATWHMLAPDSSIQQVFGFWIGTFR